MFASVAPGNEDARAGMWPLAARFWAPEHAQRIDCPARIGIFLVLPHDLDRGAVVDRRSPATSSAAVTPVASANFFYDINTKSQGVCCVANSSITSGNALSGDFTAVYKIGKWSIGPVGYFDTQTTADTGNCNPVIGGVVQNFCGRYQTAAAGGLIGYESPDNCSCPDSSGLSGVPYA